MRLLALDQATHTTGYSIFINDQPVEINHFNAKGADLADRLVDIRNRIKNLIINNNIDTVAFEDIQLQNNVIQNVKTFKMLAEVFGVILELLKEMDIEYYIIPPNVWKSTIGIAGKGRTKEKPLAQQWIFQKYGIKCTEDEADSACIGYHVIQLENNEFDWSD